MTDSNAGLRYPEIERWLRSEVAGGAVGDPLPSEQQLAAQFGVSRMTARRAVQNLAAERIVVRQRGSGTFIAPAPMHRHSGPLMSFTEDMRRRGLSASSKIVLTQVREALPEELRDLQLPDGSRVINLVRVRCADGFPMALEDTVLTPDCAAVLAENLETGSLHAALRRLGRVPTLATCRIGARLATAAETNNLALDDVEAVLVEHRVIADDADAPLERTTTIYNAKRYDIDAMFTLREDGVHEPSP